METIDLSGLPTDRSSASPASAPDSGTDAGDAEDPQRTSDTTRVDDDDTLVKIVMTSFSGVVAHCLKTAQDR